VRFDEIDAREIRQHYGRRAKQALSNLAFCKLVRAFGLHFTTISGLVDGHSSIMFFFGTSVWLGGERKITC
jgi:hypothetical protein